MNLLGIMVSYLFVGGIIAVARFFERFGKEASRKFIHIVLSLWWPLAVYFFDNVWYVRWLFPRHLSLSTGYRLGII